MRRGSGAAAFDAADGDPPRVGEFYANFAGIVVMEAADGVFLGRVQF